MRLAILITGCAPMGMDRGLLLSSRERLLSNCYHTFDININLNGCNFCVTSVNPFLAT